MDDVHGGGVGGRAVKRRHNPPGVMGVKSTERPPLSAKRPHASISCDDVRGGAGLKGKSELSAANFDVLTHVGGGVDSPPRKRGRVSTNMSVRVIQKGETRGVASVSEGGHNGGRQKRGRVGVLSEEEKGDNRGRISGVRRGSQPPTKRLRSSLLKPQELAQERQQPGVLAEDVKDTALPLGRTTNVCKDCNKKFPSSQAFDLHTNLKLKALSKVCIEKKAFKAKTQMIVCHFLDCCFTSESVENMTKHLASGKHGTRRRLIASGELKVVDKMLEVDNVYVIQRGPLAEGAGALTCPTCQTHVSSSDALAKHIKHGCHGMAAWNCPHCALQCQSMSVLHKHMAAKHPLPSSLNLTGVFRGKNKQRKIVGSDKYGARKGQIMTGVDRRAVEAFTFLASKTSSLTAEEIFKGDQKKNLLFLIDRAKGGDGAFTINVNTASLLLTSNNRKLELFNTQSPLQVYSSTVNTTHIFNKVLQAVNIASRQAADASSGLSLHTIKCVTISFAGKSGHRGAGEGKKKSPFTSSPDWANCKTVRGCVSVQLTDDHVKKDPHCQDRCFQLSILHNLFHKDVAAKLRRKQETFCQKNKHTKASSNSICSSCQRRWEADTENNVARKRGSVKPFITCASTYEEYVPRLNWTGVDFPAGCTFLFLFLVAWLLYVIYFRV